MKLEEKKSVGEVTWLPVQSARKFSAQQACKLVSA
jgi:hypothetical protein